MPRFSCTPIQRKNDHLIEAKYKMDGLWKLANNSTLYYHVEHKQKIHCISCFHLQFAYLSDHLPTTFLPYFIFIFNHTHTPITTTMETLAKLRGEFRTSATFHHKPPPRHAHRRHAPPLPHPRAQQPSNYDDKSTAPLTTPPTTSQELASKMKQLDTLLSTAQQTTAETDAEDRVVAFMASLSSPPTSKPLLRAFGTVHQVPKRSYTLEELKLNKIDTQSFLAPADVTLNNTRTTLQLGYLAGLTAGYLTHTVTDLVQLVQIVATTAFLLVADQVGNAGGIEALVVDTAGRVLSPTYSRRVALHESGHFLVAYCLGLCPKAYHLSSLEAFLSSRQLNVQAGTVFCDTKFQQEVASGSISSSSLDVYTCVALAGVATEWLRFGRAEGGLADIQQLDRLFAALGFSQKKADDQIRWAVLNVVSMLRRYEKVQDALAAAMGRGASVGECIMVIEQGMGSSG